MSDVVDPFEDEEPKGPKQRPGPNDEGLTVDVELPADISDEEAEEVARELAGRFPGATLGEIEYVEEDGTPEVTPESKDAHLEGKVLPLETPQSLPVSDVDDDPSAPAFVLARDAFGKGMHSIRLGDGTPVGVWLKEQHPDLTGPEVEDLLARMGLEEVWPGRSEWFGKHRARAIAARGELESMPAVENFAKAERLHDEQTAAMREAFLAAKKKEKA